MLIQKPLTLLRFEGKKAIFAFEDGQELVLSKDDFPKEIQVGEQCMLTLQSLHEARLKQEDLAQTLLNQILANDTQASS